MTRLTIWSWRLRTSIGIFTLSYAAILINGKSTKSLSSIRILEKRTLDQPDRGGQSIVSVEETGTAPQLETRQSDEGSGPKSDHVVSFVYGPGVILPLYTYMRVQITLSLPEQNLAWKAPLCASTVRVQRA